MVQIKWFCNELYSFIVWNVLIHWNKNSGAVWLGEGCGHGTNVVGVYYSACGTKFGFPLSHNMSDYTEVGVGMPL